MAHRKLSKALILLVSQYMMVQAQSSPSIPASPGQSYSSISPTSTGLATVTQVTTPLPTDKGWITEDQFYLKYIENGMKTAAASYLVEQQYATNSQGDFEANLNAEILASKLYPELQGHLPLRDDVRRLSVEGYFVSELPPENRAYHSSFFSVWYSYQSIKPDPSESSRLHQEVELYSSLTAARATTSSTAAAAKNTVALCAAAGAFVGFAGLL